jgi:hypothetical protein
MDYFDELNCAVTVCNLQRNAAERKRQNKKFGISFSLNSCRNIAFCKKKVLKVCINYHLNQTLGEKRATELPPFGVASRYVECKSKSSDFHKAELCF